MVIKKVAITGIAPVLGRKALWFKMLMQEHPVYDN